MSDRMTERKVHPRDVIVDVLEHSRIDENTSQIKLKRIADCILRELTDLWAAETLVGKKGL